LIARYRRPAAVPFPANNPYSDDKAALGRALFFDPRLSGSNAMSCASCHNPALGFEDGLPTAKGAGGRPLQRATPTILNLAWAELLMWDGREESLEDQTVGPIASPDEMNQPVAGLVEELSGIPGYRRLFREAFGSEEVNAARIAQALATFERTVVSGEAPFDRWVLGDEAAIGEGAKRGFALFNGKAGCAACHSSWRFTDDGFHDVGLASEDEGRGAHVPSVLALSRAFKTPTLRDVAARAPYMHDGSIRTLRGVVRHYVDGYVERPSLSPDIRRLDLSDRDVDDLVAFMETLTGRGGPISAPALPTTEKVSY
jgi:cytochrome c peroxidase